MLYHDYYDWVSSIQASKMRLRRLVCGRGFAATTLPTGTPLIKTVGASTVMSNRRHGNSATSPLSMTSSAFAHTSGRSSGKTQTSAAQFHKVPQTALVYSYAYIYYFNGFAVLPDVCREHLTNFNATFCALDFTIKAVFPRA